MNRRSVASRLWRKEGWDGVFGVKKRPLAEECGTWSRPVFDEGDRRDIREGIGLDDVCLEDDIDC